MRKKRNSRSAGTANVGGPQENAAIICIVLVVLMSAGAPRTLRAQGLTKPGVLQKYTQLPISFERRGDSEFVARGQGYVLDIRGASAAIAFPTKGSSAGVAIEFVSGRNGAATPIKELPGRVNYIVGNDSRQWRLGLPTYERVAYSGIYPGIDVEYYGNQKQFEFDLILKPGADVEAIRMRFSGVGTLRTDSDGSLLLGDLRLMAPAVIQGKQTISSRYKLLASGEVAFDLGAYDRRRPLVIDPTLVYSTRLGGGNNGNQGNAIALDSSGNAYIAGYTNAADFPVVNPAFAGYQASQDGFISKLNSTGTALIYSTYIGGSSGDWLSGIAVDSTGAAWVVGFTSSSDFPLLSPYQSEFGGTQDAVVVKLSPTGGLAYATFLGGPNFCGASGVAVDPFGNAYVTGSAGSGFPTTSGVYQPVIQGGQAGFVTKFNSMGALLWSTFLGGASFDFANAIAVDTFGNSYIAGYAASPSFPGAPVGGAQAVNNGNGDAFVAKLNFNGSALLYFTFLGGTGEDYASAISVDPSSGIAVVAGWTNSMDLSTTVGALQPANAGGADDGFIAKLNAAGSTFLYTTYLGGNRTDIINSLAVDPKGNAYVAGYSNSNTFPTSAAIQTSIQGNNISLFRTTNTGASWTPFDTNLPGAASGLSPDPANASTVIASTDAGTYRTTNGGSVWTQQTPAGYMTLSRSPANPAVIYGSTGSAIYRSPDNGVTWPYQGSVPLCCSGSVIADPKNSGTAYVFYPGNPVASAVVKTIDDGVDWVPAITGLPATPNINAMAAGSDGSLYLGLCYSAGVSPGGVYKSSNQGGTWALVYSGPPGDTGFCVPQHGLAVAATSPSVIYVSDYFTLYESTDAGATWNIVGLFPGGTSSLAVSNFSSTTLYYGGNATSQMWVSTDSGVTWSPGLGLGVASANLTISDPANAAGAYALTPVSSVPIVAKIDTAGQHLLYSTYLGDYGGVFGIAANGTGDVFVTGSSWELPTTPSALQRNRNFDQNVLDAFVVRISDATAACSYSVDPPQSLEAWYTRLIQYVVTAPSGCPWTASSDQPWATIASGASGSGSGIVYILAVANNTSTALTANLTIAGQSVPLIVRPASCGGNGFSPDTSVVPGGGGSVQVGLVVGDGCQWSLTNNDPNAITVVSGATGNGNGTVTMDVAPNLGPNERTFVLGTGQASGSETITQAGTTAPAVVAAITSSPSGASFTTIGTGCIPGTYTAPAALTWNANTNCTIVFPSPQTIGGSQYVFQSATVNGGPNTTTNPLTVNSGSSPPTIAANFMAPCSYSLSPSGQSFTSQGGLGSFTVTTAAACGWNAVPSAGWITILPSGSKGTGKVSYAVASNSGAARSGSITAGGQNFSIAQQAFGCTFTISPAVAAFNDPGGNVRVVVTAPSGCGWGATSHALWMTASVASGTGTGAVTITAAANTGAARSGTVTIAGQTFSATQGAGACGALDVTSEVGVYQGGFQFIPPAGSNLYSQQIKIANNSGAAITGPLNYVLIGLPSSSGAGLTIGFPLTHCFSAGGSFMVPVPGGGLAAGASVAFNLTFVAPVGAPNYTAKVLSGTPSK